MTFRPHVTDLALARRLERAEGAANAAFVESRALHAPALGATWSEVGGTYAMFDGVGSPLTQTFGLGLFAAPSADDLQALEDFFRARGAEVFHEVSPLADPALLPLLSGRGYHPIELTTVLRLPLDDASPPAVSARLAYARAEGCDLAMMGAAPGSTSQANAERQGFRIAYTRIKWQLAA